MTTRRRNALRFAAAMTFWVLTAQAACFAQETMTAAGTEPARVIYRWRVKPGMEAAFIEAWKRTTRAIRAATPDALGSELLRSHDAPAEYVAIARWRSVAAWRAFRATPRDPIPGVAEMNAAGELVSAEPVEEVASLVDR